MCRHGTISGQSDGIQPELALAFCTSNVNMWGLGTLVREKVEAKTTDSEHCGHLMSVLPPRQAGKFRTGCEHWWTCRPIQRPRVPHPALPCARGGYVAFYVTSLLTSWYSPRKTRLGLTLLGELSSQAAAPARREPHPAASIKRCRQPCPAPITQGVQSPLAVTPLQDSRKRQVFIERRPVQTKWRDFNTAHIFLGSEFQSRVALGRKTHLMATGQSDKDHSSLMPCLQGTVSQGARPIFV